MSELKSLGRLSDALIDKLKKAKLMIVARASEVWVDDGDLKKANEIIKEHEGVTVKEGKKREAVHRFSGFLLSLPENIKINQNYVGGAYDRTGRAGNFSLIEYGKPSDGLDSSMQKKKIDSVTIKNQKIELNASAFTPAYSGIVMTDQNQIPLFEISAYNIFVLFDTRANPEATKAIYEKLLIFSIMLADSEDEKSREYYTGIWNRQAEVREKYEIKQFRDMFMAGIKTEADAIRRKITSDEANVASYSAEIFKSTKSLYENNLKLDALSENGEKVMEKRAQDEWRRVKDFEKTGAVSNIRITQTHLMFRTRNIKWTPKSESKEFMNPADRVSTVTAYRNDPVEFGEYEISINISGAFAATIKNMTKTLSYEGFTWHHPHVKDGNVCYGNMAETLPKFTARREYEAIMMCILKWLENVDIQDAWGLRIYYWIDEHNKTASARKKKREEAEKAAKEKAEADEKSKKKAEEVAPVPVLVEKETKVAMEPKRVVRFVTE